MAAFFLGIPGPFAGLFNTDLALLIAYTVSALTLIIVSLNDKTNKLSAHTN
ncbi:MAG: hypothetical protein LBB68_00865 [Treponema sp.]|nr:hypothetical protein [Treponema sp.]